MNNQFSRIMPPPLGSTSDLGNVKLIPFKLKNESVNIVIKCFLQELDQYNLPVAR